MLDDLRRIIESEMEYDDINDIMMEATDNAIADMFIEEDGEAIISDSEVMGILEKIPEYDEESAMNKKLARIAEAYIPEELGYEEVEEGVMNRFRMRKWSKEELKEEINELKEEINELENKEEKDKKDEKRLKKAKKELADAEHLLNVRSERDEEVRESYEYDDEEMLEEGFASKRILKKYSKEDLQEKINKLQEEIGELEGMEERDKKQNKRLEKAKKELANIQDFMDKNFAEVQETTEIREFYEMFDLDDLL